MFDEIFVVDAKPTEKAKKHIDECVSQGVCLCGCGRKATRRGLSDRCYYAFMREFTRMDDKSAKKYEGALIRKGLVLAQGMCRRIKRRISKFVAIAEEYRG